MILYLKILGIAMIPVLLSALFTLLERKTSFEQLPYALRQIIIGVVFGAAAIFGTEFGVNIGGAQVNARDAAPLCAGLIFGGPAGIIAGCIGGIERWIAVYWGVGAYTRIACSVSTVLAGCLAAYLRAFMCDHRRPAALIGGSIALVMELFHMVTVFLTHLDDPNPAYEVIRICTGPMVAANVISVFLALVIVRGILGEPMPRIRDIRDITQKMQVRLSAAILVGYLLTTSFTFILQSSMADNQVSKLLRINLEDIRDNITTASDDNILRIARKASSEMGMDMKSKPLEAKARRFEFSEINVVNADGVIIASTNPDFIGFDMHSGPQSRAFLCLLDGTKEYVQAYQPISYDKTVSRKYAGIAMRGGFLQFGYDEERFQTDIADQVTNLTVNRHIGETGFMAILDNSDRIVSTPPNDSIAWDISDEELQRIRNIDVPEYDLFRTTIDGIEHYCMYAVNEGYYVFAAQTVEEVNHARDVGFYVNSFTTLLIYFVLFVIIHFIIKNLVVKNMRSVNASLAQITAGNLDERVNVTETSEFESLSEDINSTVDTLKRYISEAKARIDEELELARNIQSSALPRVFPPFPSRDEIDLFASMYPAKEVGGDFYDYYWLGRNRLAILIADVSGKGIPGAMFMMTAKTMLKNYAESGLPIEDVIVHANNELCANNDAGMFVTAWMAVVDVSTGHMDYVNAGHNPPLIRDPEGKFEYLRGRSGFVLAGMDGVPYRRQSIDLKPGSILYAYTDGVTEATDIHETLYGEDRLLNCLNAHAHEDMQTLCRSVKADVDAFVGEAPQFDDITMLALKLHRLTGGANHNGTEV